MHYAAMLMMMSQNLKSAGFTKISISGERNIGRGREGGRTFQKSSHLGEVTKYFARKGGQH